MSGSQRLVHSILNCSRISYFSDHIERRARDGQGNLVPFLGFFKGDDVIGIFRVIDNGNDYANLVVDDVGIDEIVEGLTEYILLEISDYFDGPVKEFYDNYSLDDGIIRYFSGASFSYGGVSLRISISEDAPTLFDVFTSEL